MNPKLKALTAANITAVLILATGTAFFTQPLVRFADLAALATAGGWLSGGAAILYAEISGPLHVRWARVLMLVLAAAMFVYGAVSVAWVQVAASKNAELTDRQCARIQQAMLHPTKRTRKDLPELFQALGCRPQF